MIQERNKPTFLQRLHPSTKLWMSLGIILAVFLFANPWFSFSLMAIGIIWIYKENFILEFKIVAFAIFTMGLSMFLINGTLNPVNNFSNDPVFVLPLLNWKFYKEGLEYALRVFGRIAPLMATLFLLFRTINMTDLGVALHEAGISYRSSFIFITTFQMLPVITKDMRQITDAQKSRGLDTEGSLLNRAKAFIPIMLPVIANSITKVQEQAIALETKGFNSTNPKTIYRTLERSKADHILKWCSISVCGLAVVYRLVLILL